MWKFTIAPARFADEKLASISVEYSANLANADEFGVFVALWCGRIRDFVNVDGKPQRFTFGFLSGELLVEPSCGRISNQGRLEVEAGRFKILQTEAEQTKKEGAIGGDLGFDIGKWFGLTKAAASAGAHLNTTISRTEQRDGEYYQVYWRVADAGHNFWRVYGIGLNTEGVLENKIVGESPLCFIVPEGHNTIDILVSFRCDLRDLWFQRDDPALSIKDVRFDREQEERNRTAVAARVVAAALNRRIGQSSGDIVEKTVILARQKLRADRDDTGQVRD